MQYYAEILREEYKRRVANIQPLPWCDMPVFHLDDIYVNLGMTHRDKKRSQLTNRTVTLGNVFMRHGDVKKPRSVLIEGSPGMGKTTTSMKLAYDWATGRLPEEFPHFDLLLLVKCRDLESDIWSSVEEQLLPLDLKENLKKGLFEFVQENPHRVLLVLDGLDECDEAGERLVGDVIRRKRLVNCFLVATSREEKGLCLRQFFDILVYIRGFSTETINEYILRHFKNNEFHAERLIQNVNSDSRLRNLATSPLNTALLCLVFEDFSGELPSTQTELYSNIVYCITKRYCVKQSIEFSDDNLVEKFQDEFVVLGKLAYEGLLDDRLYFLESKLSKNQRNLSKLGFLLKEASQTKLKRECRFLFLHKTLQEYFAAKYLTHLLEKQENGMAGLLHTIKARKFLQVWLFLSGMVKASVNRYFETLGEILQESGTRTRPFLKNNNEEYLMLLCQMIAETKFSEVAASVLYPRFPVDLKLHTKRPNVVRGFSAILEATSRNVLSTCRSAVPLQYVDLTVGYFAGTSILELNLLVDVLSRCNTVTSFKLEVKEDRLNSNAIPNCTKIISKNKTLRNLEVYYRSLSAHESLSASSMFESLARSPCLTSFVLFSCHLKLPDDDDAITTFLKSNATLTSLALPHNSIQLQQAKQIACALKENKTLTHLDLAGNLLHDDGVAAVAEMLADNCSLVSLILSYNFISKEGAAFLASGLENNSTLKKLDLGGNQLGDKGVKALTKVCFTDPEQTAVGAHLQSLVLRKVGCGDKAATVIATMLKTNYTITHLDLSLNFIHKKGATALVKALLSNSELKALHICLNPVTDIIKEIPGEFFSNSRIYCPHFHRWLRVEKTKLVRKHCLLFTEDTVMRRVFSWEMAHRGFFYQHDGDLV